MRPPAGHPRGPQFLPPIFPSPIPPTGASRPTRPASGCAPRPISARPMSSPGARPLSPLSCRHRLLRLHPGRVVPIRPPRAHDFRSGCRNHPDVWWRHDAWLVSNAFRLLVRSGRTLDQRRVQRRVLRGLKRLSAVGPIRTLVIAPKASHTQWSQTPFGCWSDQDTKKRSRISTGRRRHKRLSAVGPIRTVHHLLEARA